MVASSPTTSDRVIYKRKSGAVVRLTLEQLDLDTLRVECLRLLECLNVVQTCCDKRCSLCPYCFAAVFPQATAVKPPKIRKDDPIRNYTQQKAHEQRERNRIRATNVTTKMLQLREEAAERMARMQR